MRYPNTFIIGAPKAGTTSIFNWLSQHPEVCVSNPKEPHYFYSPFGKALPPNMYKRIFREARAGAKIFVEASVWYLYGGCAVETIERSINGPKYIVCLRNPLEMAPSLHYQKCYSGHESLLSFREAWDISPRRGRGEFIGIRRLAPEGDPCHMDYRSVCMLGRQVDRLLKNVEGERVSFIFFEDIKERPQYVMSALCKFLSIEERNSIQFNHENSAKRARLQRLKSALDTASKLKKRVGITKSIGVLGSLNKINTVKHRYDPVPNSLLKEMRLHFEEDISLLSEQTSRDLSQWLAAP